ncbi:MAG TPA: TonB-dependent receptor, partial [Burkholderiaceae bacterium]|nr:TonB-dependent receptor [Burkholderiaceae bacterium]
DLQGSTARFMPAYMVRGFAAANALSGMRTNRGAIPLDAAFLERIEVPKGPSGVVSGMAGLGSAFVSELGGTINMERKRAGPGTPAGITQTLDSADGGTLRFIGDVGGSWPGDMDWRIIGYASRSGRTDGGYDGKNSGGLLGSLQWGRGPFSAGLALQVDGSRNVPAPTSRGGLIRLPDNTLSIVPVESGVAAPLNPQDRLRARGADVDLELGWQLLPKWRVDLRGRVEEVRNEWTRTEILFKPLISVPNSNRLHVMQVNLSGELATGAAIHKIVLGLDAQRNRKQDTRFDATGAPLLTQITEHRQEVLLMDQISLGRWRLRLSAQRAAVSGLEAVINDKPVEALGTGGTNGDVGLLYQLRPSTAIYAGLQSTVEAGNFSLAQLTLGDGSMRPPARMNQTQLGLKMELPDYRSTLSAEIFRIRKFNTTVQTKEGLALVPGRYVNGLELELSGRPHPSVDLSLGYSVMRARNVQYSGDTADMLLSTEGRTAGIPRRSLQLLARVRLPEQVLPDTSLGIGLRAASDMLVGIPGLQQGVGVRNSDYVLPGGGQLDVSLERLWGPWALKAFIRNLTDQQLYAPTYEVTYLPLRPARHFGLTLTYKE